MISSFFIYGIYFGIVQSFGVILVHLKTCYKDDPDVTTKASLVGSLAYGATFLLSPLASMLSDKIGIRNVAIFGSICSFCGILGSSFAVEYQVSMILSIRTCKNVSDIYLVSIINSWNGCILHMALSLEEAQDF